MYLAAGCAKHRWDKAPLELAPKSCAALIIGDGVAHNDVFLLQIFDEHTTVVAIEHIGNPGGVQWRSAPEVYAVGRRGWNGSEHKTILDAIIKDVVGGGLWWCA